MTLETLTALMPGWTITETDNGDLSAIDADGCTMLFTPDTDRAVLAAWIQRSQDRHREHTR